MTFYPKHMGRNSLVDRLASQVGSRKTAIDILIKRGHMHPDGVTLTEQGVRRNEMTAEERAIDRAVKTRGGTPSSYIYDPITNKARTLYGRQIKDELQSSDEVGPPRQEDDGQGLF